MIKLDINPTDALSKQARHWLTAAQQHNPNLDFGLLAQACDFAEEIGGHAAILFSSSALTQGLAIAHELLALNCDSITLAAAILYPTVFYRHPSQELLQEKFGQNVIKLITGVGRMAGIHAMTRNDHTPSNPEQQVDNLRKMLLTMVDDVRTVLIKLAERLVILKYLRHATPEEQRPIALETSALYAPLANRLGVGQIKWQMEDLSFRFLHTDTYNSISKQLKMRRSEREIYVHDFIKILEDLLHNTDITDFEITGRAKHIYSISRKLTKKQVDLSQIYDTTAVRVLVPTIKDCYAVLSAAHNQWQHISQEFDDYIAKPKPNGYRSIHTVVIGPQDINVEIQIRTHKMHQEAELGVAAHWKYKEGTHATGSSFEEKINWLRNVMDWQKEVSEPQQEGLFEKIFADRIYVFTPRGDVYDLPQGATPLDFAFHIHSDIGNHCRGAKVNDKLVPLTHTLNTGDKIDILTANNHQPSRDWINPNLGYLTTTRARQKVRNWFRKIDQEQHYNAGLTLWEKAWRREHLAKHALNDIASHFNLHSSRDVIIALGAGDLNISTVIKTIKPEEKAKPAVTPVPVPSKTVTDKNTKPNSGFTIEGVGNLLMQLARCCRPIPGDHILGYITQGRGVSIHQQQCRNIQYNVKRNPARVLAVSWGKQDRTSPVSLSIEAEDREGLVRDITGVIASNNISLLSFTSRLDSIQNRAYIQCTIEVKNMESLTKIQSQLRQIPGLIKAKRL